MLAVSPFPHLFAIHLSAARRLLIVLGLSALPPPIGPMPLLLCLQDGAVWREVSDAPAVAASHVAVGVSGCLHGDTAACDRLGAGRARKIVAVHGVCHMPNVHQLKVPFLLAGGLHPFLLYRENLQNDVFVTLVMHFLSHFLEKVTASVQDVKYVVEILAGLHLLVDQLLVARPSNLPGVTVVLIVQSLPSCMSVPCSIFRLLAFEMLDARSWFACFYVCSAALASVREDDGWALP